MPEVSLRAFDYGEITDGDPYDLSTRSAKKLLNVDIDRGAGLAVARLGYADYADINPLQNVEDSSTIPAGTHVFYKIIPYQTGLTTTQNNTLIITRNPAGTEFTVYSNAPSGGNGYKYKKFETVSATSCDAKIVDGIVYVSYDNTKYHRVLYSLYDLFGGTRGYFGNGALTVTSVTSNPASLGAGGIIFLGHIYDEHRLYTDGSTESVSLNYTGEVAISGSYTALPTGRWSFFAVPVFDGDPDQYGIPAFASSGGVIVQTIELTNTNKYLAFNVLVNNGTTFNRRMKRIDLFCQYASLDNSTREADYASVVSIDISTGIAAPFAATWSASGGGYVVTVTFDGRMYRNFTTTFWSQVSGGRPVSHALADISVKATMLAHVKERMFAIGTENDLGGEKIRHTSMGWGGKGCRDVWWRLNTFWKEGGYKINYIKEWRGRLYFFQHVNSYYMDVAQRQLPTPWPLDYKTDESGYGFGTELVNTISGCPEGILFANFQSIFLLDGETPVDILDGKKKDEWLAISDADKALAVGRYNAFRNTYWIKIRNGSSWEIWLYNMNMKQKNWRTYQFYYKPNDEPIYFFRDSNNKFVFVANNQLYEYEKKGGGNTISDNGAGIHCEIHTQHLDLGTLSNNIVYRLKARLNTIGTAADMPRIQFVRDEQTPATPITPPLMMLQKFHGYTSYDDDSAHVRELNFMCQSIQMRFTLEMNNNATSLPSVKQLDLLYTTEPKV